MGAQSFQNSGKGRSAKEVFLKIRDEAAYENGHGGYTGTIAEKGEFREVNLPPNRELGSYIDELIDDGGKFGDKWGPAGCICTKQPQPIVPLSKGETAKLAVEKFGPTATVEIKRSGGKVTAFLKVISKNGGMGMNESVPGGYRNTQKFAQGDDADQARGALFAEEGEYVFFGWASS